MMGGAIMAEGDVGDQADVGRRQLLPLTPHPDPQEALRIGPPPPQRQACRRISEGLCGGDGRSSGLVFAAWERA